MGFCGWGVRFAVKSPWRCMGVRPSCGGAWGPGVGLVGRDGEPGLGLGTSVSLVGRVGRGTHEGSQCARWGGFLRVGGARAARMGAVGLPRLCKQQGSLLCRGRLVGAFHDRRFPCRPGRAGVDAVRAAPRTSMAAFLTERGRLGRWQTAHGSGGWCGCILLSARQVDLRAVRVSFAIAPLQSIPNAASMQSACHGCGG
jgi:hypothetical protein